MAVELGVRRVIFASSTAIFKFGSTKEIVDEDRVPDADFAYARTKKQGEEMMRKYSAHVPCTVVRFAAVFSDWCEYALLFRFLAKWVSGKWDSRILGGRGESAIPYIHIYDLIVCLMTILSRDAELPHFDVYIASPSRSVSHNELFRLTMLYYFGRERKPIYLPKLLAYPGLAARAVLRKFRLTCEEAFERMWMLQYIDMKLIVNASRTYRLLGWQPKSRYHIMRRLLFLLEKMKSYPDEWRVRNEAKLRSVTQRANLLIYEHMMSLKDELLPQIKEEILSVPFNRRLKRYRQLEPADFTCYLQALYHVLLAAVRSGDRALMLEYIDDVAMYRFTEGFTADEIREVLSLYRRRIIAGLYDIPVLKAFHQEIYDAVGLTIQLAQDEIEELYENLLLRSPQKGVAAQPNVPDCTRLQKLIRQLSNFYQVAPHEHLRSLSPEKQKRGSHPEK
jgi:nucleoside-diphosphate-sugar epimerase